VYPGYYPGTVPAVGEPPVDGTAYFHDGTSATGYSSPVRVCTVSFDGGATPTVVYKLPQPPVSDAAYCTVMAALPPRPQN
jgi:hypothetical protein